MGPARPAPEAPRGERGSLLVLVLVSLLALTGLVLLVMDLAFQGARDTGQLSQEYSAGFMAEAGLDVALTLLAQDSVSGADTQFEPWSFPFRTKDMAISITPCNALLNLNGLSPSGQVEQVQRTRQALKALLVKMGQPSDKADRLMEWEMPVKAVTGGIGASTSFYSQTQPRYHSRRDILQRPEEALLVEGWNGFDPDWIRRSFTTWGDVDKVNINFVSEDTIKAYLPELASYYTAIDAWRRTKGFQDVSQLLTVTGMSQESAAYNAILPYITVSSDYFQVIVETDAPGLTMWTRYIVRRSGLASLQKAQVVSRDVLMTRPLNS